MGLAAKEIEWPFYNYVAEILQKPSDHEIDQLAKGRAVDIVFG
jgi:hypothetical protein